MGFFDGLFGKKNSELSGEGYYMLSCQHLEKGDTKTAVDYLRKAAEKDYMEAVFLIGNMYEYGNYIEKDEYKAIDYYRRAAMSGHVDAKYCLGGCYLLGKGVPKDEEQAFAYLKEAADAGHEKAKFLYDVETYFYYEEWHLAMDYFYGRNGHEINVPKALKILRKGVDVCSDGGAMYLLGHIEIIGAPPYVPQNIEDGVRKFVEAAKMGDDNSFIWLMSMYRHGQSYEGVSFEKNEALAGKYAVEIADAKDEEEIDSTQGMVYATAAWAYLFGHGVQKNEMKAKFYFDKIEEYNKYSGFIKEIGDELKKRGF